MLTNCGDFSAALVYLKTCTPRPILRGFSAESATESAHYTQESPDYTTDSVIVGWLPLSNMFNILNVPELADGNRPTIAVGRQEMVLVGTGLKSGAFHWLHMELGGGEGSQASKKFPLHIKCKRKGGGLSDGM